MTIYTAPDTAPSLDVFIAGDYLPNDWQSEAAASLDSEGLDVAIATPPSDPARINAPVEHIHWDREHMALARVLLFWIPQHDIHPLALCQLAFYAGRGRKDIILGRAPKGAIPLHLFPYLEEAPEIASFDTMEEAIQVADVTAHQVREEEEDSAEEGQS